MDIILFEGSGQKVEVLKIPPKGPRKGEIVVVRGEDDTINRVAVSSKHVDILLDPHIGNRRDFMHHRDSGLNQVLCNLAKKNNVAIGFSFSVILNARNRGKLMGRMMQNIKLCRKYKIPIVIGTFARNKWELRNEADIQAFFKVLGMTGKEVKMDFVEKRIEHKRRYIKKGVMLSK